MHSSSFIISALEMTDKIKMCLIDVDSLSRIFHQLLCQVKTGMLPTVGIVKVLLHNLDQFTKTKGT